MYYSARTFVGADTAAAALGIIDRGDVIAYAYRLLRTVFLTYAAAYAADITVFSSGLAVVDRHAADPLPAVERDQADYMLRTGGYADAAAAALAVIDRRHSRISRQRGSSSRRCRVRCSRSGRAYLLRRAWMRLCSPAHPRRYTFSLHICRFPST